MKLRQFLKKNISCNFVNQRHHGASVKTPGGFVDILNPFTLKNLESYTVCFSILQLPSISNKKLVLLKIRITMLLVSIANFSTRNKPSFRNNLLQIG